MHWTTIRDDFRHESYGRPAPPAGCRLPVGVALLLLTAAPSGAQESAWRLDEALATPDWLDVGGSYQARLEAMDNSFRVVDPGSDQLLVARLLLAVEARGDRFYAGAELEDARAWLHDVGTPVGTDDVNAGELLRAYVGYRRSDLFAAGDRFDLSLGRLTMNFGSRRLVARNVFRTTVNAFTGALAAWSLPDTVDLQAFYTLPVSRLPTALERERLLDNEVEFDRESTATRFWGIRASNLKIGSGAAGELYWYELDESDSPRLPTRNRDITTLGLRVTGDRGAWSWELEAAHQTGTSRATPLPIDQLDLDHRAWFVHVEAVRRFETDRNTRLALRYDYASGDRDPNDGEMERFDSLFGARPFDFGPISLYGPLARSNLKSPGVRVDFDVVDGVDAQVGYRAAWVAARRDFLPTGGVRDRDGQSGSFIGHQLDFRLRWFAIPQSLRIDLGGAYLVKGEILEDAPTAPPSGNTIFGYLMAVFTF